MNTSNKNNGLDRGPQNQIKRPHTVGSGTNSAQQSRGYQPQRPALRQSVPSGQGPARPQRPISPNPGKGQSGSRPAGAGGTGGQRRAPAAPPPSRLAFWHYCIATTVYWELLLATLVGWDGLGLTWLYLILTGCAVGLFFGGIYSMIKNVTARKIFSHTYLAAGAVIFLVQFFIRRNFQKFMTLKSILSESTNAMGTFGDIIFEIILKGFWIIILFFIPLIAFSLIGRKKLNMRRFKGKIPLAMIAGALAAELLCFGVMAMSSTARNKMGSQYEFDSAVNCFGLGNALLLDTVGGFGGDDYVPPVPLAPPQQPVDTGTETETDSSGNVVAPPVVYGKNELSSIDFNALAENEKNKDVKKLHQSIAAMVGSYQNKYTGMFKGKNLILITAEAFSAEVIDPDLTPTLYRLANNGINFTDYYQPAWGGSTLTGEASIITGLVPMGGVAGVKETAKKNLYMTIGNSLMREGYFSRAFHNHNYTYYSRNTMHENFGYEKFIGLGNGMEVGVKGVWPESDLEMMQTTVDWYIDHQPFSIYYMTVSGHCNYNWGGNSMSSKNRNEVSHIEGSEAIKAYYASQLELEKGLTYLVQRLEDAGIADDTLIVLSTDHYPYGLENGSFGNTEDYVTELYGYKYSNFAERDHSKLIMWSGAFEKMEEKIVVDGPTYSLDILPTLLNLFGIEFDSRLLVGRDVFSGTEAIVCWTDYSWKTERGFYYSRTGEFTPNEGYEADKEYIKRINSIVAYKIYFSKAALNLDYYNKIFG